MKNKRWAALCLGLVALVLGSLLPVATPAKAGVLAWTPDNPSTAGNVIGPTGIDVVDLAVAADNHTAYAVTGATAGIGIYKTTNGGSTWVKVTNPSGVGANITRVAVAPGVVDGSSVGIIADGSEVYFSTNAGVTWTSFGTPLGATLLNAIDISPAVAGNVTIAVGGSISATGEVWYLNPGVGTWINATVTDIPGTGWDATSFGAAISVWDVKFSPNFAGDRTFLAVTDNGSSTSVQIAVFSSRKWNGANGFPGWGTGLAVVASGTVSSASLVLAPSFLGADETRRVAYVGVTGSTGSGLFRASNTALTALTPALTVKVNSVALNSTGDLLVAGSYATNSVIRVASPATANATGVLLSGPEESPGANNVPDPKVVVACAGANVVAGTSGPESAFSVSANDGACFIDVGLVDTTFVPRDSIASPDGSSIYVASSIGGYLSVWRKAASWERVLSVGVEPTSNDFLVRGDPADFNVVYVSERNVRPATLYLSSDGGQEDWQTRLAPKGIMDLAVESASVLYAITSDNTVSKSTDSGLVWDNPLRTLTFAPFSIVSLSPGSLLVGGAGGQVAYSPDGNNTWTQIGPAIPGGGNVSVTASGLISGSFIYAASSSANNSYRWTIGTSTSWTAMRSSSISPSYGVALASGALYVLANAGANSTLYRTPVPATAASDADWVAVPVAGKVFGDTPRALSVGGTHTLWAINQASNTLESYTDAMPIPPVGPFDSMTYLGMNPHVALSPFLDPRVRLATYLALDRDSLQNVSGGEKVRSTVDPEASNSNIDRSRDTATATQLLWESAYPYGFLTTLTTYPALQDMANAVRQSLLDVHVVCNVTVLPSRAALLSQLAGGNVQFFLADTAVDWSQPADIITRLLRTGGSENFTGYSNPQFDGYVDSDSYQAAEDLAFDSDSGGFAIAPLTWQGAMPLALTSAVEPADVPSFTPPEVPGIPLRDIPLQNIPLQDIPLLWSTPLQDISLWDTPLQDIPLQDIPLQDIPLRNLSWDEVLAGTSFEGRDLRDITLRDLSLAGIPLQDISIADILLAMLPLQDIEINGVPLQDILLSGTPLQDIPLQDIPLQDINLAGTPMQDIPLQDIPLQDIPLQDIGRLNMVLGTPLQDIPLQDITLRRLLEAGIPLRYGSPLAVPLQDIPLQDIGGVDWHTRLAGTPLQDIPLQDITLAELALAGVPLQDTTVGGVLLQNIPLQDITILGTPLQDIPLQDIDGVNWPTKLAGTPLQDIPLQDITLGDLVLNGIPLNDITIGDIILAGTPLQDISVRGTPLQDIPLQDIPLTGTSWTAILAGSTLLHDADPSSTTLADVLLADIPLHDIPLQDILLRDILINGIPLQDIPLQDISILGTPLQDIPLQDIAGVNWTSKLAGTLLQDIPLQDITLKDLVLAGIPLDDITFGQLPLQDITLLDLLLGYVPLQDITLWQLLLAFIPLQDIGWEAVPLEDIPLGDVYGVTYTDTLTNYNSITADNVTVTHVLPVGFTYVPGSATAALAPLSGGLPVGAGAPIPDPAISGQSLTFGMFTIPGAPAAAATALTVRFKAVSATALGTSGTGNLSADCINFGPAGPVPSGPVTVIDAIEANGSPETAVEIAKDNLYFSYINSATDVDWYKIPAPEKGSMLTIYLSHLPADYDLALLATVEAPTDITSQDPPLEDYCFAGNLSSGYPAAILAAGYLHGARPDRRRDR